MSALFVALEGPDGCGKSTIIKMLESYLKKQQINVLTTREPGGTPLGEKIRHLLLDKHNHGIAPRTEALLYSAARAQHVEECIKPALQEDKIVLTDRFVLSSVAYQGAGRGLGLRTIEQLNEFATGGLEPDLVLFFQIDPSITLQRKCHRDELDRMELESSSFHQKVYEGYLQIVQERKDQPGFYVIDASQSIEDVFQQVIVILKLRIGGIV